MRRYWVKQKISIKNNHLRKALPHAAAWHGDCNNRYAGHAGFESRRVHQMNE